MDGNRITLTTNACKGVNTLVVRNVREGGLQSCSGCCDGLLGKFRSPFFPKKRKKKKKRKSSCASLLVGLKRPSDNMAELTQAQLDDGVRRLRGHFRHGQQQDLDNDVLISVLQMMGGDGESASMLPQPHRCCCVIVEEECSVLLFNPHTHTCTRTRTHVLCVYDDVCT